MKKEFTLQAVRQMRDEHVKEHAQVLSDIDNATPDELSSVPGYVFPNIECAHSAFISVLERVASDLEAERKCNETDLDLIEIRGIHYKRQVADLRRCHRPKA